MQQQTKQQTAEQKLDDNIISLTAEHQQSGFERGEHNKEWCDEAEEQFRELLMFMPFDGKQKLHHKLSQDLLAREAVSDSDDE
jgi:polysaccharide deacetylase 2 family uncharacterized protein YibQ